MSASDVCQPPPPLAFSDEPPLVASPSQRSRQPRQLRLVEAGEEHNKEEKEDDENVCRRCSGVRREANGPPASGCGRAEDSEVLASRGDRESPDRRFGDDRQRALDAELQSAAARVAAAPTASGVRPKRDRTTDGAAAVADGVLGSSGQAKRLAGCGQADRSGDSSSCSRSCCYCAVNDAAVSVKMPIADFVAAAAASRCGCQQHERSDHHCARSALANIPITAGERPMSAIVEEASTCVDEGFDDDDEGDAAAAAAEDGCSAEEDLEEDEAESDSSGSLRRRRRRKSSTSDLEQLKRLTARLGLNARRPSYTAWQQQLVAAAAAAPLTTPFSPASFSAATIAANFAAAAVRPRRASASAAGAAAATTLTACKSAAILEIGADRGGGVVADACNRYDGQGDREGDGRRDEGADTTGASDLVCSIADADVVATAGANVATDVRTTIARVDQLLHSLKAELIKMQETDQTLAKQFIALRQDVQQLRLQQARMRYEDLIDEAAAQLEAAAAVAAGGRPGYEEMLSDDGMLPPAPPSLLRGRLDSSTSSGIGGCSCDPDTADALAQLASIGITKMNLLERRFSVF